MPATDSPRVIDLRDIGPGVRHTIVFQLFENLRPGEAIEIVNDHDPQMLWRQMGLRFGDRVAWTYSESGPDVWRIRISRASHGTGEAPAPGNEPA